MLPLFYMDIYLFHVLSIDGHGRWMIKMPSYVDGYFGYRDGTGGATTFEWFGPQTPQQTFQCK